MRGQFIPVRKSDVVDALAAPGGPAAGLGEGFGEFCRLFGLTLHYEYFDELERLKRLYFHFDPMMAGEGGPAPSEGDYAELIRALEDVLGRANFTEVPEAEVARAGREHGIVPVGVKSPVDDYRLIRFFRRGERRDKVTDRDWLGRVKAEREVPVNEDVVLVAAAKPAAMAKAGRRRRNGATAGGAVLVKYFHDIASADLDTLLPGVRVVMNGRDRWILGLPALFGGIPLALKLAPTLAILLVLAGVQLGSSAAVEADHLKQALAVLTGLVALGSFCAHQWLKYQRTALRYQVAIKDNLYFRNVNNNSGVFDALVGAAEEQDFKEAMLAYCFLAAKPSEKARLDARVEAWLRERFAVDVDFEVDDGLAKLERYGLLIREGERLAVVQVAEALSRLDRRWDDYFSFAAPATAPV